MKKAYLLIGNMKMHKTTSELIPQAHELNEALYEAPHTVVLCPPYTALWTLQHILKNPLLKLGAQDMHHEEQGSFTGEISATMLRDAGCEYVIVGHSERRQLCGQTDELINKKLLQALHYGFKVVLCIGESLEERRTQQTYQVLERQLRSALLHSHKFHNIIIAYEPLWTIGQEAPVTPQELASVQKDISAILSSVIVRGCAEDIQLIYGGSVNAGCVEELLAVEGIQGVMVGRACLDVEQFLALIGVKRSKKARR